MTTWTKVLAAFLALALLVPAAATAQYDRGTQDERTRDQNQRNQQQDQQTRDRQASQDFQPKLFQTDDLIGASVKNAQGEDLGKIEDLVMDSQHQNVSYAVLAFGGFLGLGKNLRAIPWQALTIQRGDLEPGKDGMRTDSTARDQTDRDRYRDRDSETTIVLNATKEQLENAEGFSNDDWPDTGNERWTQNVYSSFYGQAGNQGHEPTTMAGRTPGADRRDTDRRGGEEAMKSRRLSNILGETVKVNKGDDIGKIKTILIDGNRGDLAYAIVDVSGLDDLGDTERVAIPWRSLQTRGDNLTVMLDKASLGRMNFEDDGLKQLENRTHASRQHALSMSEPYWQGPGDEKRSGQGQQRGTEQSDRYGTQTGTTTTITGKITRVMHETKQGQENLCFEVMTEDGRRIIVDAGQKSRAGQQSREDQKQAKFEKGDQVTVVGTRQIKGDDQETFMAQTIRNGSNVLNVQRTDQDSKRDKR